MVALCSNPATCASQPQRARPARRYPAARKEKQLFSQSVDPRDLHRLISSFSFHYVANSYTFTLLFEEGADEQAQRQHYRKMAVQVALRYTCP